MHVARAPNWILSLVLAVLSVSLGLFGVSGWADAASVYETPWAGSLGGSVAHLNPLWPIYALAAIGCVAAQILAACAVVNFARLSGAPRVWRFLAIAFYGVAVFFSAYSADMGAQVVLNSGQRSVYESRHRDRVSLASEIDHLSATIAAARARLPVAGLVGPKTQDAAIATFEATTSVERSRLPVAQEELKSKPELTRDRPKSLLDTLVFLIFLGWALLEPWGYALAERGREVAPTSHAATNGVRVLRSREPGVLRRLMAIFGLIRLAAGATDGPALAETRAIEPITNPDPITLKSEMDEKAVAFSMRGRFSVEEIANKVGRDRSTIYRWFAKRDTQAA